MITRANSAIGVHAFRQQGGTGDGKSPVPGFACLPAAKRGTLLHFSLYPSTGNFSPLHSQKSAGHKVPRAAE
jgi:hypothetical protein